MRPACLSLLACAAALWPAHADAADLWTVEGKAGLVESACTLDVTIDGVVGKVTSRHRVENRTAQPQEALYRFDLPDDAAVVGLEVTLKGGRTATAFVVDAEAAIATARDPDVDAKPDVAILRLIDRRGGRATYEWRVYPVEPKGVVEVRTTWLEPLRFDGGRLSLRIPGRGTAANLAREQVNLSIAPPAGAKGLGEVTGGGKVLARDAGAGKVSYKFTAPADGDLVVESTPKLPPGQPLVTVAAAPVGDDGGALAVAVLAPPPQASDVPHYDRVLFVIDVSRSMAPQGVRAAREIAAAVLASVGVEARVEAILFDRTARRVHGGWVANDREALRKLDLALAEAPLANGTDLGAALAQARAILRERSRRERDDERRGLAPSTLVVVISDGVTPVALDAASATARFGEELLEQVFLVNVTIYPDGAAAPAVDAGPAARLAIRAGGRSVAIRDVDAKARGATFAAELAQPAPLRSLDLDVGAATLDPLGLPVELAPGQGAFAVRRYRGKLPAEVALTGALGGEPVRVPARKVSGLLATATLPLWLVNATLEGFVPEGERIAADAADALAYDTPTEQVAVRAFQEAAGRVRVVTSLTSLVALDPKDAFARDRAAFVKRWGPSFFERLPPPPERGVDAVPLEHPRLPIGRAAAPPAAAPTPRTLALTGDLDAGIVRRVLRTYLVPRARACYQQLLRTNSRAEGKIDLVLELARGEVQSASVAASTFRTAELDVCLVDAAYLIEVPRVAVGDEPDAISVVRYPLTFKIVDRDANVSDERDPLQATPPADPARGGTPVQRDP